MSLAKHAKALADSANAPYITEKTYCYRHNSPADLG